MESFLTRRPVRHIVPLPCELQNPPRVCKPCGSLFVRALKKECRTRRGQDGSDGRDGRAARAF